MLKHAWHLEAACMPASIMHMQCKGTCHVASHIAAQELEAVGQQVLQMPPAECQVLYGRCGNLYALLLACKYVTPSQQTS